ncbi:hypothetical protein HN51_070373, partial [Arachis hypogaea]
MANKSHIARSFEKAIIGTIHRRLTWPCARMTRTNCKRTILGLSEHRGKNDHPPISQSLFIAQTSVPVFLILKDTELKTCFCFENAAD